MILGSPNCAACGLDKKTNIPVYGKGKRGLLILFDSQLPVHNTMNSFATGYEYSFIRDTLYQYGIIVEDDCYVASAIRCFTKRPVIKNMECCKGALDFLIDSLKPKVILTVGSLSARYILKDTIPGAVNLERVHGFTHNFRKHKCYSVSTWLPFKESYKTVVSNKIIERDIMQAVIALTMPYREWKGEADCITLLNTKEAKNWLKTQVSSNKTQWHAIDYETTGLRPYNKGHKILSCAISDGVDSSYAFMMEDELIPYMKQYLEAEHIKKIAHNMQFELMWSDDKIGTWGNSMNVCSMLLTHTIDNRDTGVTGVGFIAPMLLGCKPWDKDVAQYIGADKRDEAKYGNNALNNMHRVPPRKLLMYNGIDSLVEMRIAVLMMQTLLNIDKTFPTYENIGHWEEVMYELSISM